MVIPSEDREIAVLPPAESIQNQDEKPVTLMHPLHAAVRPELSRIVIGLKQMVASTLMPTTCGASHCAWSIHTGACEPVSHPPIFTPLAPLGPTKDADASLQSPLCP